MGILNPDYTMVEQVSVIVDEVNAWYSEELKLNHDMDDIWSLAEMLNTVTKKTNLPIKWSADESPRSNPDEWVSALAGITSKGKRRIEVILWECNLNEKWGPKTFKEVVLDMMCHETIHFRQYARIGHAKLSVLASGHQKGLQREAISGDYEDYMTSYLGDPHELMAYGFDLMRDIKESDFPDDALRQPETFSDELPVYKFYRNFFPAESKQIKRLLSYAARYYVQADYRLEQIELKKKVTKALNE